MNRHLLSAALSCAFLTTLANEAYASNYAVYNGGSCVPVTGSSSLAYTYGAMYNSSTSSTQYAYCPIVRDETTTTSYSATLYVYSYSSSYPVTCKLYDLSPTTGSGYMSSASMTSSSSGYQTLSMSSITTVSGNREYIYCSIAKSPSSTSYITSIQGYYVTE